MSAYKKNINIAFKYTGSGSNKQTTTYQIDNLYLGDDNAVKASDVLKEGFESVTKDADVVLRRGHVIHIILGNQYLQTTCIIIPYGHIKT